MNYQNMNDAQLAAQIKFLQRQVTEGNSMAARNQLKEAKIEELSRKTLGSYAKKSAFNMSQHAHELGKSDSITGQMKPLSKVNKRMQGHAKAVDRLSKEEVESVMETLPKSADAGDWIKDFEKSDAPQFKGKSKGKRREMAIAAYMHNKEGYELDEDLLIFAEQKAAEMDEGTYEIRGAAPKNNFFSNKGDGVRPGYGTAKPDKGTLAKGGHFASLTGTAKPAQRFSSMGAAQAHLAKKKMGEEAGNIEELSGSKITDYVQKASQDVGKRIGTGKGLERKTLARSMSIGSAKAKLKNKLGEEEQMNELSDNKLSQYMSAVSSDATKHKSDPTKRSPEKRSRSVAGFAKAHNRLAKRDTKEGMMEAATDDKNPTRHGAEKAHAADGRGTVGAVKGCTGTSTFDKNPQLLGRNADVESGKQWMVSFVNGIPDCLVPGETENEVVARMRMIMTDPQKLNQVKDVQKTSGENNLAHMHKLKQIGEHNVIEVDGEQYVFETLESIPFFETAQLGMALINAGAPAEFLKQVDQVLREHEMGSELCLEDIEAVLTVAGLEAHEIDEVTAYL